VCIMEQEIIEPTTLSSELPSPPCFEPFKFQQQVSRTKMASQPSFMTSVMVTATLAVAASLPTIVSAQHMQVNHIGAEHANPNPNNAQSVSSKQSFRIFQTLPQDPSTMDAIELNRIVRATQAMIFGNNGITGRTGDSMISNEWEDMGLALDIYSPAERREYLVQRGNKCHPSTSHVGHGSPGSFGGGEEGDHSNLAWYDVLARYDSLLATSNISDSSNSNSSKNARAQSKELERLATELWKFCVLYNGDGHTYLDYQEGVLLRPLMEVISPDSNYGVVASDSTYSTFSTKSVEEGRYIHESFLSISPYQPAKSELGAMIRLILETSDDMLALSPLLLPREMHRLIVGRDSNAIVEGNTDGESNGDIKSVNVAGISSGSDGSATWNLLKNSCIDLADPASSSKTTAAQHNNNSDNNEVSISSAHASFFAYPSSSSTLSGLGVSSPDAYARRTAARCPLAEGGYCCTAFMTGNGDSVPVLALRHPVGGWPVSSSVMGSSSSSTAMINKANLPYKLKPVDSEDTSKASADDEIRKDLPHVLGGVPDSDLPYISSVRLIRNDTDSIKSSLSSSFSASGALATHPADTPNFFDILFENDCLPYRKECHRCLKDVSNEAPEGDDDGVSNRNQYNKLATKHVMQNACSKCKLECPCYCDTLCKVRPPPKKVTRTYAVHPPRYKKVPDRLVPKIVHQTWFEPVTREKYPNMSRLIESWKKSGWEYYFYDDDTAVEFLATHFPPEIREAYESITPGAFKADLFRYCVLLIRGGVYADMDVLLETNLDDAIGSDIGFMTPIDEPGIDVGHRSCLWNGLIASAPGHPFLARTIEIVVNNIRNRFTAVDYDDMLCPNPILSVSHTVDTLFTCGPCILGAGINNILGRHMQYEFDIGDIDIWEVEREELKKKNPHLTNDYSLAVSPDDPRLLIPGRSVILEQNKNDMGAHRFTWADRHLIIAATDMPDYDDRPPTKEHYSKTHEKAGIYGVRKLYTDNKRANEEIRIVVEKL